MKRSFAWFAVGMLLMPAMLLAHMLPARRSGSLKGLVTDSAGVPLRGATIRLIGTSPLRGGIAAPNGAYAIPLLAPGFYRVKVTMVGRGPIELPGVRIGAGRATVADFTLIFVPILGDTIEVRALPSTRPEAIPQGEHAFLPAPGVGCRSFHDVAEREPNSSSVT